MACRYISIRNLVLFYLWCHNRKVAWFVKYNCDVLIFRHNVEWWAEQMQAYLRSILWAKVEQLEDSYLLTFIIGTSILQQMLTSLSSKLCRRFVRKEIKYQLIIWDETAQRDETLWNLNHCTALYIFFFPAITPLYSPVWIKERAEGSRNAASWMWSKFPGTNFVPSSWWRHCRVQSLYPAMP